LSISFLEIFCWANAFSIWKMDEQRSSLVGDPLKDKRPAEKRDSFLRFFIFFISLYLLQMLGRSVKEWNRNDENIH
jgi:hypothetical protein